MLCLFDANICAGKVQNKEKQKEGSVGLPSTGGAVDQRGIIRDARTCPHSCGLKSGGLTTPLRVKHEWWAGTWSRGKVSWWGADITCEPQLVPSTADFRRTNCGLAAFQLT